MHAAQVQAMPDRGLEYSKQEFRNCGSPHAARGLRPGSGYLDFGDQSRSCSLDLWVIMDGPSQGRSIG
jgi:hypothetical protein